ncbi:MAG: DUF4070 domain-containing protein [Candidatus Rokubacteria bacterium]|nr:DUF4070 domain-containing protein [Candidatus Rokubacteria bacterium]
MAHRYQHVLMVCPEFPKTYWGLQYSLPLFGRKALMPPLGLLTVAAMIPPAYEVRVVDLNCQPLTQKDLDWADMVCFSAMHTQQVSLFETARRCRTAGKLVVFGGPFPTLSPEQCRPYCDVLVLNEAEVTWPAFLEDLGRGTYRDVYASDEKPDVTKVPVPRFDLVNARDYGSMPIQFSRGCPFECEFCDIIVMFGRRPRAKTPKQFLAELEAIYATGYRGMIFLVDDNFIGNKKEVKRLLPELQAWNEAHGRPFVYGTEASLDLAYDEALLKQMAACHFKWVFVGIETPSLESLKETRKFQNMKGSLLDSVKAIQKAGMVVWGGFIVGFDNDGEDIFDRQIEFITRAAIPVGHVAILFALPGTPLYKRLEETGRLEPIDYDPTAVRSEDMRYIYTNIATILPRRQLLEGYGRILDRIYQPSAYFKRSLEALCQLPRPESLTARIRNLFWLGTLALKNFTGSRGMGLFGFGAWRFLRDLLGQLPAEYRRESLRFAWQVLRKCPDHLPYMLLFIITGVHHYRFTFEHTLPDIKMEQERGLPERTEVAASPSAGGHLGGGAS